jgi:hypothetical protein
MPLPKLDSPIFELTLPSSGETIKYRPFLVKEQKILMIAMEGQSEKDMLNAIKQIINNCAVDKVEVEKLPIFDIEYFFTRLRAKSVGETVDLKLQHGARLNSSGESCKHVTNFRLNLLEVEVEKAEDHSDKIILDEERGIGIKLTYPKIDLAKYVAKKKNEIDGVIEAIKECTEYIFDKENVYMRKDHSANELDSFINDLSQEQFTKIVNFFKSMPKLKHTIKWKCAECNHEDSVTLEGMQSFFVS